MGRNRDIKRKSHTPPSLCARCGEQHYLGLEHLCIEAVTTYDGLIPSTKFTLIRHHPEQELIISQNWVQTSRLMVSMGLGSQKQVFEDLGRAKEKTDGDPQQP